MSGIRVRVWYDTTGAELGTPWKVQYPDGRTRLFAHVSMHDVELVYRPDEAPHGVAEGDVYGPYAELA